MNHNKHTHLSLLWHKHYGLLLLRSGLFTKQRVSALFLFPNVKVRQDTEQEADLSESGQKFKSQKLLNNQ